MRGFWSKKWQVIQSRYYARIGSRRTGERWLASLIIKLWDISWDLWQHRNDVLFDKQQSILIDRELQHIVDEFEEGFDGIPDSFSTYTTRTFDEIAAYPPYKRSLWLINIRAAQKVAQSTQDQLEYRALRRQQQLMRTTFQVTGTRRAPVRQHRTRRQVNPQALLRQQALMRRFLNPNNQA